MKKDEKQLYDLANTKCIIYLITNLVNNKKYVGQTEKTFNRRYDGCGVGIERVKRSYETNGYRGNHHLYNSIKKYGTENFKVEIIHIAQSREELNYFESFYERYYNTTNPKYGYNKKPCGDCINKTWHNSDEWYLEHYSKKYPKEIDKVKKFLEKRHKHGTYTGNECYDLFSAEILFNYKRYIGLLSIPYKETRTHSIGKLYEQSEWEYWKRNESQQKIQNTIEEKRKTIIEKLNYMKQEYLTLCENYNDNELIMLQNEYPMLYKYCKYKCEEINSDFDYRSVYKILKEEL